jgi:hypothetical protein
VAEFPEPAEGDFAEEEAPVVHTGFDSRQVIFQQGQGRKSIDAVILFVALLSSGCGASGFSGMEKGNQQAFRSQI